MATKHGRARPAVEDLRAILVFRLITAQTLGVDSHLRLRQHLADLDTITHLDIGRQLRAPDSVAAIRHPPSGARCRASWLPRCRDSPT